MVTLYHQLIQVLISTPLAVVDYREDMCHKHCDLMSTLTSQYQCVPLSTLLVHALVIYLKTQQESHSVLKWILYILNSSVVSMGYCFILKPLFCLSLVTFNSLNLFCILCCILLCVDMTVHRWPYLVSSSELSSASPW